MIFSFWISLEILLILKSEHIQTTIPHPPWAILKEKQAESVLVFLS
jgi:hypothetical protein